MSLLPFTNNFPKSSIEMYEGERMGAGDNDLTLATLRQNKAHDAVSQIFFNLH